MLDDIDDALGLRLRLVLVPKGEEDFGIAMGDEYLSLCKLLTLHTTDAIDTAKGRTGLRTVALRLRALAIHAARSADRIDSLR